MQTTTGRPAHRTPDPATTVLDLSTPSTRPLPVLVPQQPTGPGPARHATVPPRPAVPAQSRGWFLTNCAVVGAALGILAGLIAITPPTITLHSVPDPAPSSSPASSAAARPVRLAPAPAATQARHRSTRPPTTAPAAQHRPRRTPAAAPARHRATPAPTTPAAATRTRAAVTKPPTTLSPTPSTATPPPPPAVVQNPAAAEPIGTP